MCDSWRCPDSLTAPQGDPRPHAAGCSLEKGPNEQHMVLVSLVMLRISFPWKNSKTLVFILSQKENFSETSPGADVLSFEQL